MKRRNFIRNTIAGSLTFSGLRGTIKLFSGFMDFKETIKLKINEFEFKLFENPDSFYWPAYFWIWNDTLTKDIIKKQLGDMALKGALSVLISDSRNVGLGCPGLSQETDEGIHLRRKGVILLPEPKHGAIGLERRTYSG